MIVSREIKCIFYDICVERVFLVQDSVNSSVEILTKMRIPGHVNLTLGLTTLSLMRRWQARYRNLAWVLIVEALIILTQGQRLYWWPPLAGTTGLKLANCPTGLLLAAFSNYPSEFLPQDATLGCSEYTPAK